MYEEGTRGYTGITCVVPQLFSRLLYSPFFFSFLFTFLSYLLFSTNCDHTSLPTSHLIIMCFSFASLSKHTPDSKLAADVKQQAGRKRSHIRALVEAQWPNGQCVSSRSERSGFEPCLGTKCCVLGHDT